MRAAVLLALAASAMAYSISSPNDTNGWSCKGPNKVKWDRVSTDPKKNRDILSKPVMVARRVNGADRTATINSPGGGWREGSGYRINFEDKTDSILAQSMTFDIKCLEDTTPSRNQSQNSTPKLPSLS
ncbi:hypothetical protein BDZ89DRAFT_1153890 [Hymenopellis radicata]|nr:hypothetical protein BDZ89DRAFT_1153890 [Hymenopellis radicata]